MELNRKEQLNFPMETLVSWPKAQGFLPKLKPVSEHIIDLSAGRMWVTLCGIQVNILISMQNARTTFYVWHIKWYHIHLMYLLHMQNKNKPYYHTGIITLTLGDISFLFLFAFSRKLCVKS